MNETTGKEANPVIITPDKVKHTSTQLKAHLLCGGCESRFNNNGERWMLTNGYRGEERFALRDALLKTKPEAVSPDLKQAFAFNSDIDSGRLIYFASSVFWRASVIDWGGVTRRMNLGSRYQEEFRRFLLGESDFPASARLIIEVSDSNSPLRFAIVPSGSNQGGWHQHGFVLLGVRFHLLVGSKVPSQLDPLCFVHSPSKPMFLNRVLDQKGKDIALRLSDFARAKQKAR